MPKCDELPFLNQNILAWNWDFMKNVLPWEQKMPKILLSKNVIS